MFDLDALGIYLHRNVLPSRPVGTGPPDTRILAEGVRISGFVMVV